MAADEATPREWRRARLLHLLRSELPWERRLRLRRRRMSREWILRIVAPDVWLTANKPSGKNARTRLIKAWRTAAFQAARAARLPKDLHRVRIGPVAHFRAGRPAPVKDLPNLSSTIKAVIDGLGREQRGKKPDGTPWIAVGYGLIPDDSDVHLDLEQTVRGERLPAKVYGSHGELVLRIREVTP